jgi:hypothetical protein
MAKQSGLVKISGNIDDLTFSKTKDGHLVRKRGKVVTKDEIANGKQYARVRENMSEFTRATEAARLFRATFNDSMAYCVDKTLISRSATAMMSVLSSDPISDRGERSVMNGNAKLLKDFLLNSKGRFGNICAKEYTTSIERATGKLTFTMQVFVPANVIVAPPGSTHFQFYSAAAAVNFDTGDYELKQASSASIPNTDKTATAIIVQEHMLTPGSTVPLFLVAGIRFFQEVNGKSYPLYNAAFNTLCIADADSL